MILAPRAIARTSGLLYCHAECDSRMAPRAVKAHRRALKRSDRNAWKRDVRREA